MWCEDGGSKDLCYKDLLNNWTNINKIHIKQLVYICRDFAKSFSYRCIHQTADPCDIKGRATSELQTFETLFRAILFILIDFARHLSRSGVRCQALRSNKPIHYLLDYSAFYWKKSWQIEHVRTLSNNLLVRAML